MKSVLYIGSGNSARLIDKVNLDNYIVCCANNAWKLFIGKKIDYWIHSGDFPSENRPTKNDNIDIKKEISYSDYQLTSENITKKLNLQCNSPQHHLGYTIFFLGLYWIIDFLEPDKISLLGFDHDYNPSKVKKWNENKRPTPQNYITKTQDQTIKEWSESFFEGMRPDSFYGQGTPDPMRLGENHLLDKFKQVMKITKDLNIDLVNLSPVISKLNLLPKEKILPNGQIPIKSHLGGHLFTTHIETKSVLYLRDKYNIKTAYDLGCGPGGMIKQMSAMNIETKGIDGDVNVKPDILHDFNNGTLNLNSVDLCYSVEFLEHIKEEYLDNVFSVINTASIVLCTASPNANRHLHFNPQPVSYWIRQFESRGWVLSAEDTEWVRSNSDMKRNFFRDTGMVFLNKKYQNIHKS